MICIVIECTFSIKEYLLVAYSTSISCVAFLIGGFDLLVMSLCCLMALDFISGLMVGYKRKKLNSKRAYNGLRKKMMELFILCAATIIDRLIPNVGIRNLVGLFYCAAEVLSLIENASKIGIRVPKKLEQALEQCQQEEE